MSQKDTHHHQENELLVVQMASWLKKAPPNATTPANTPARIRNNAPATASATQAVTESLAPEKEQCFEACENVEDEETACLTGDEGDCDDNDSGASDGADDVLPDSAMSEDLFKSHTGPICNATP